MDNEWTIAACVTGVFAIIMGVTALISNHAEFIGRTAAIERLRVDVLNVSAAESEDVIGQVTAQNQIIANRQRWNRVPFVSLFMPDGWDTIQPIELPKR